MKDRVVFQIKRTDRSEISIERHGFVNLIYEDAKTDFGAQCMTVRYPNKLLTDLTFSADGLLNPESLLVVISRAPKP